MNPLRAALASFLLLAAGCAGPGFALEPPADFLLLEPRRGSGWALRATSADGVVLGVRELPNERQGTLAFWRDAVRERLRVGKGYALVGEEPVRAASGEEGVRLCFGRDEGGRAYTYWVTLFTAPGGALSPPRLLLVEAGGEREAFSELEPALAQAVAGLEVR